MCPVLLFVNEYEMSFFLATLFLNSFDEERVDQIKFRSTGFNPLPLLDPFTYGDP